MAQLSDNVATMWRTDDMDEKMFSRNERCDMIFIQWMLNELDAFNDEGTEFRNMNLYMMLMYEFIYTMHLLNIVIRKFSEFA